MSPYADSTDSQTDHPALPIKYMSLIRVPPVRMGENHA